MVLSKAFQAWLRHFWEEPFFQIELQRAEMFRDDANGDKVRLEKKRGVNFAN